MFANDLVDEVNQFFSYKFKFCFAQFFKIFFVPFSFSFNLFLKTNKKVVLLPLGAMLYSNLGIVFMSLISVLAIQLQMPELLMTSRVLGSMLNSIIYTAIVAFVIVSGEYY